MLQVLIRHMVLVPCLAINGPFHKRLLSHIQFSQTVDYDMDMNVAAAIVPVHVRTDQCLMSRKVGFCVFQSKLLCPFSRQAIFCAVPARSCPIFSGVFSGKTRRMHIQYQRYPAGVAHAIFKVRCNFVRN